MTSLRNTCHSKRRPSISDWITERSLGNDRRQWSAGQHRDLNHRLYGAVKCVRSWNPRKTVDHTDYGAIYNFDFSTDGSILVAACQNRSIIMFDPLNGKLIGSKYKAHDKDVNCVKFLDSRMFATGSDDTTVRLWDCRSLKQEVMTLSRHDGWVKNVDYSHGYLLTSGFDGYIYRWDINKPIHCITNEFNLNALLSSSEDDADCRPVLYHKSMMRSKLTPDGTKLIVSTQNGYLLLIHDLDLSTLFHDLKVFVTNTTDVLKEATCSRLVRSGRKKIRNRVEVIRDFPTRDDAESISSIDVHPQGWCVVSRNTSVLDNSEWTCVHDIQETSQDLRTAGYERGASSDAQSVLPRGCWLIQRDMVRRPRSFNALDPNEHDEFVMFHDMEDGSRFDLIPADTETDSETDTEAGLNGVHNNARRSSDVVSVRIAEDYVGFGLDSLIEAARLLLPSTRRRQRRRLISRGGMLVYSASGANVYSTSSANRYVDDFNANIPGRSAYELNPVAANISHSDAIADHHPSRVVLNRLTHYIEEPVAGRGFIKEIGFGAGGRLVCSPFGYGVRLLAFDSCCSELADCVPDAAVQMHEVAANISHAAVVLSAKFSPTHLLFVTGCLNGKVDFHQPVL